MQGLHAINLGDSGFMVVRDGCTIFRSPVQQHDFNFTFQLESGNNGDLPSSGQVTLIIFFVFCSCLSCSDLGTWSYFLASQLTYVLMH